MAEVLVIVGVVASIVQLVDFSTRVARRIEEFHSHTGEIPKSFQSIKAELPLLSNTLQQLKDAIDAGMVADGTKQALLPVIEGCREQVTQLDAILAKTLPEVNDSWRERSKKAIKSLNKDAKVESIAKILRNYIGILTFYYASASSTLQSITDKKLSKICCWLSPPDSSTNYQKALKQRQANTGLWFLDSVQYSRWKTFDASFLWLHGIPGCGKTILHSTVLEDVLQYCHDDPGKAAAYFFFDFQDAQKQDPGLMLRSLICQLSQQFFQVPSSLDTLFSSCQNGLQQPSIHALLDVTQKIIKDFPHVFLTLDALDECTQRPELLGMLETIAKWQLPNLHLLATSRRERDIETSLETLVEDQDRICVQSSLVDKDIKRYIRQRLSDDKSLRKWKKDAVIQREIETILMNGACGMFRWAACQLDGLGKCRNRATLRKMLTTLPSTLDQTYERILCAISNEDSTYAIQILQWLTFSVRPLSVKEIAEVVAFNVERDPIFDRDEILEDPMDVLSICSSLVTIQPPNDWKFWRRPQRTLRRSDSDLSESDTTESDMTESDMTESETSETEKTNYIVRLAHYSVKEYLLSERACRGKAKKYYMQYDICHNDIAMSCVSYLLQFQKKEIPRSRKERLVQRKKLAQYSADFCIHHAQLLERPTEKFNQMVMDLISKENKAYKNWHKIERSSGPQIGFETPSLINTPLDRAVYYGLLEVVELLLNKATDIDVQHFIHGKAIYLASSRNYIPLIRLLLDRGTDVNAADEGGFSPLCHAASRGHEQAVKLLLDRGAEVNIQGKRSISVIFCAFFNIKIEVLKLLLAKGANVNTEDGYSVKPLHRAIELGNEQIVRLLLDAGADINAHHGVYRNAIQAASSKGNKDIVELLLSRHDVDVEACDQTGRTPLLLAAENGHGPVVELLVAKRSASGHAKLKEPGVSLSHVVSNELAGVKESLDNRHSADFNFLRLGNG
ncbi:hypothetical protein B0J11DRAFT_582674 [Dendryphion nanum]|uniref:NACHT domain-containing protein n=1 Tax=Dendryphion nanum TaxID=256645 RepID=A0A9P9DE60_9PLEO|nr:hypothetical protein B0J11DRAFT_582674 [Dendryphion nanum]